MTNIKSRGGLIFPNKKIFGIIIGLEDAFEKCCDSYEVFQETVDFLFIITYYITMRMRQYSRISNQKQIRNHGKKKLFKLIAT